MPSEPEDASQQRDEGGRRPARRDPSQGDKGRSRPEQRNSRDGAGPGDRPNRSDRPQRTDRGADDRQLARAYSEVAAKNRAKAPLLAMFADHALTLADDPDLAERLFVQAVEASADKPEYIAQIAEVLIAEGHDRHAQAVIAAAARVGVRLH